MFEIAGLDHIVLRTTRLAPMLDFYCGVLGCVVERETSPALGLTQLRAGEALIDLVVVDSELGRVGGGPPAATGNDQSLDGLVRDVGAVRRVCASAAAVFFSPPGASDTA